VTARRRTTAGAAESRRHFGRLFDLPGRVGQGLGFPADYAAMKTLSLSRDAVTVFGLAGPALRFALSIDDEVERWLRPLRLFGESGAALLGMGVSEARREGSVEVPSQQSSSSPEETLHIITMAASKLAAERDASSVGTLDILTAVMTHYGEAFERALESHAGDLTELARRLADRTAKGRRRRALDLLHLSPLGLR
jgi:hypothetical protein